VKTIQTEASPQTDEYSLFNVEPQASPAATKPLVVEVIINLSMEVDTGSAVTLVSEHTFKSKWPNSPLQSSAVKL